MKKIDKSVISKIREYRRQGNSFKQIAQTLDLSPATAYKYSKDIKVSVRRKTTPKKKVKIPTKITRNLVRIIGHCMFDGSVFESKKDYIIRYTNSSKEEVNKFVEDMWETFRLLPTSVIKRKGKYIDWFEATFSSKKVFDFLHNFAISFSTISETGFREEFLSLLSKNLKIELLRTFWCDEGSVAKDGKIVGKSKSLRIIHQLKNLHESLGIKTSIWRDNTSKIYGLYIKKNKRNIKLFSKIGFGNGIVTRGKFIGLKKNKVLVKLYGPVIS